MDIYAEYQRGIELMRAGDYEAALAVIHHVLDIEKGKVSAQDREDAWGTVASINLRLGRFEAADEAIRYAPSHRSSYEQQRSLFASPAHGLMVRAYEQSSAGDHAGALQSLGQALQLENLDDDLRFELFHRVAMVYLRLGEWGRAEEYQTASRGLRQEDYDKNRAELMAKAHVNPQSLPHYDGSALDDVFARARQHYDQGEYRVALDGLIPIMGPSFEHEAFGQEVCLYVALCHLRLKNIGDAELTAGALTGAFRDAYEEQRAALAGSTGAP